MVTSSKPTRVANLAAATTAPLRTVRQTNALSEAMKALNASRLSGEPSNPDEARQAPQDHQDFIGLAQRGMVDAGLPETPAPHVSTRRRVSSTADLGGFVRERRLEMSLTQQDLADAAGTGRRFVSELEGGKATLEVGRIIQVCRILGIDLFAMSR